MKAIILNTVNNRSFEVEKETIEELDAFIAYQKNKKKCPWGNLEIQKTVNPSAYPDRAVFSEETIIQEPSVDEELNPVMEQDGNIKDEEGSDILDGEGNTIPNMIPVMIDVIKHIVIIPQEFEIFKDVAPVNKAPIYFEELRSKRCVCLFNTDWSQIADAPLTTTERNHYREYRQYLRDLPLSYDNTSIINYNIMNLSEWKAFKGYDL